MAKQKPEVLYSLTLNGRSLKGERWGGRWLFFTPDYPDIPEHYDGDADASEAIEEFMRRAMGAAEQSGG